MQRKELIDLLDPTKTKCRFCGKIINIVGACQIPLLGKIVLVCKSKCHIRGKLGKPVQA